MIRSPADKAVPCQPSFCWNHSDQSTVSYQHTIAAITSIL